MKEPVVLYSIQSYLAYYINTEFYGDKHYVWCAPFFDSNKESHLIPKLPYTSNPIDIFKAYYKDISTYDRHYKGAEIKRNTVALLKGAKIMYKKGVIDASTYDNVKKTIDNCSKDDRVVEYFRPLIYVISYKLNESIVKKVDVGKRAGALSPEYLIEALPTGRFSVIDLGQEGIK